MTRKQQKAIAKLWAGGYIRQLDIGDLTSVGVSIKDAYAIRKEIVKISDNLIKGHSFPFSLDGIIRNITNNG